MAAGAPARRQVLLASHNIMDGLRMDGLLPLYARLHERAAPGAVGLLCIQEHQPGVADAIARALGPTYRAAVDGRAPRLATVYDTRWLRLAHSRVLNLPLLDKVPLWQQLYAATEPEQKHAALLRFDRAAGGGGAMLVANFHLDAAGTNTHRANQLCAVADALAAERHALVPVGAPAGAAFARAVACGDTNCFSFVRARSARWLGEMVRPLERLGLRDLAADDDLDNHFFKRAREPKLGQRIAVFFGQFGVDFPCRYTVLCTDLPALAHGQVEAVDSDHDIVWANVGFEDE